MIIGDRYSDKKLYRGIKYYNNMPLTSGDLHEYEDILSKKNEYLTNNLLGSGTLNEPSCVVSAGGVSLSSSIVLMLDGDISLINSDENVPLVSMSDIVSAGYSSGIVCIVGWYQHIPNSGTIRSYGGVNNSILSNDIIDTYLGVQVSTRYQFRWDIKILDASSYDNSIVTFTIPSRDATGAAVTPASTVTINAVASRGDDIRVSTVPEAMSSYVVGSSIYIAPILTYHYSNSTLIDVATYRSRKISYSLDEHKQVKVFTAGEAHSTASTETIAFDTTVTSSDIIEVYYNGVKMRLNFEYTISLVSQNLSIPDAIIEAGDCLEINKISIQ